ncbi:MAG TPA: methyltransferase domain-containing protein [Anaerolineae bacterium]|jgi:ubiquinone/menaquinone biosynthesis C-methylase UbiE
MIEDTISTAEVQRYYDRLGARLGWADVFEARSKRGGLDLLDVSPGQTVLNVGVGIGQEQARLRATVSPGGLAVGIDISPVMLDLTRLRTDAPTCRADARHLPFRTASFDRLLAAYFFDLIPVTEFRQLLVEFRRVLKPGCPLVLVSLTEGINRSSRLMVTLWKMIYRISPVWCGGCRPVECAGLLHSVGFNRVERAVVIQWGVPSEVIVARQSIV